MKSFREALLSLFAIGIVLYLYFVAGGVALLSLCGFLLHRDGPETPDHFPVRANASLPHQTYATGEPSLGIAIKQGPEKLS